MSLVLGVLLTTATVSPPGIRAGCARMVQAAFTNAGVPGPLCSQPLAMTLVRPPARAHHT